MKIGVVFPQLESGTDPAAIKAYVQAVETMGFDYLLAYEHLLGADPARYPDRSFVYTYETLFHEPFVLFGFLAGFTSRLELVTGIVILPQRNTAATAKQAAEVDVLSGGRLRLGIGVGWNQAEMEGAGYTFHDRGRRVDEQIVVMKALWSKPLVTFEGRYHKLDAVGINPRPVQQPLPLWFGGAADAMLRRMARHGEGWITNHLTAESAQDVLAALRQYLAEERRDPAAFGIDFRINMARTPRSEWESVIEGWRAAGATHVAINTMGAGFATLNDHLEGVQAFWEMAQKLR